MRYLLLFAVCAWGQAGFEERVRPVLSAKCLACHSGATPMGGVDFASGAGVSKSAEKLMAAIAYDGRVKMPPTGKLKADELAVLNEWARGGALWPKTVSKGGTDHWAFQPLKPGTGKSIDEFLRAKQAERGLRPAGRADKLTLLQRAAFDLTGLPPSAEDTRLFLADASPGAFAAAVDRLLASPRYGEKWGRHWMDVARYADSTGADEDYRYPHAWKYRDWVIDAFNRDMRFPEFVRNQIAGDLLPPPAGQEVNTAGIIATGFLALGPKLVAEQDKVKMFYDAVDEQIDVVGKALLGLTISCARCHDHKFDPISTKDYYSMASIFASTRQFEQIEGTVSKLFYVPLAGKKEMEPWNAHQKRMADKQKEIDAAVGAESRKRRDLLAPEIARYMLAAKQVIGGGAADAALDAAVLARWVTYLKPNKERRIHLEDWYKKGDAAAYQASYLAEVARRDKAQADYKAGLLKEAPKFPAGLNRFYTEVSAAKGPLGLPEKDSEAVAKLKAELKLIKDAAPVEPPFACGVAEDKSVDQHVFVRGNPESKGELVAKQFPLVLAGAQQPAVKSVSGRLELANWLADGGHPLPLRVMVNRIWQGHFGQGLVRTPSNFGVAGERPTHPELLDWLAGEFVRRGSSFKAMHRLIMLSDAYQMSGETTDVNAEKDADNRLWTRFPMRRKTVEEIRDSLLLLDGSLDLTMGGALTSGTGTDNEFSDARKSMHPDDSKRRTVYLPLRRSNLSTLFTLFDFGDATTSTEMREQTNVAPQALYMMNSKFVTERSKALAAKLLRNGTDDAGRVRAAWETVLGRAPEAGEVAGSLSYMAGFPKLPGNDDGRLLAWSSLCRTLIASNDFIYVP